LRKVVNTAGGKDTALSLVWEALFKPDSVL